MYIFYTTTLHMHIAFSKYINPSTEQQRVNLTSKMAEADTQDARLSCIFINFPFLWSCFAHQFDDTHSCQYNIVSILISMDSILFFMCDMALIYGYVLCFFVWEALLAKTWLDYPKGRNHQKKIYC